jgi:predicted transcriptional regulator
MEQVTDVVPEDTQSILLRHIEQNPGVRYRELSRLTGLANGVLTYHLAALERSSVIKAERRSRMTHYYPISVSEKESMMLKHIRHEPMRRIMLFLLDHQFCTFNEVVDHTKKAPSTVSSHLKKLRGEYHLYSLADKALVYEVLAKYRPSLTDKVVDNYVEMAEEL